MTTTDYIEDAIESISGAGVHYVKSNVSRTIIDFAFGEGSDMSLYDRARSGEWASSVMVDTANAEVSRATLRYGALGLPVGSDLHLAETEVEKVIDAANPPAKSPLQGGDAFQVRFRDWTSGHLEHEGFDIIHVEVRERVPARGFADWLPRFTRMYRREKPSIRERVQELGHNE